MPNMPRDPGIGRDNSVRETSTPRQIGIDPSLSSAVDATRYTAGTQPNRNRVATAIAGTNVNWTADEAPSRQEDTDDNISRRRDRAV